MESEVDGWGGASLASCFELWGTVWYDWCERGRLEWPNGLPGPARAR
jgi:hypothetical protein